MNNAPETLYVVTKPHTPESPKTLQASAGDWLTFERRQTEWAGWIWCSSPDNRQAWVPENWVTIEGDVCCLRRDYDSTELAIQPGETLVVEEIESGWAWGMTDRGDWGWVPLTCLRKK
jgi:hypothetical protein